MKSVIGVVTTQCIKEGKGEAFRRMVSFAVSLQA